MARWIIGSSLRLASYDVLGRAWGSILRFASAGTASKRTGADQEIGAGVYRSNASVLNQKFAAFSMLLLAQCIGRSVRLRREYHRRILSIETAWDWRCGRR